MNGYFVLFVALCISFVAAYYSIVGLATIFAAATIPVIIMGSVLEVAKLVTASWLYENWKSIPILMKAYFTIAVIILMFITSMGIFGFLSKAHIEQSGGIAQTSAQIDRKQTEIEQIDETIARLELEAGELSTRSSRNFDTIQSQIDREQENIDRIYQRVQPDIDRVQNSIDTAIEERDTLRLSLDTLETAIDQNRIATAQRIVGVPDDGQIGPQTRSAIETYRQNTSSRLQTLNSAIQENTSRIETIRNEVEPSVQRSLDLIDSLRSQIVIDDDNNNSERIEIIRNEIGELRDEKSLTQDELFDLQAESRMFEVEVGPVKYIAEFVYGEANEEVTEKAIRWVILIIITVFDPLAVLLVIAANMTILQNFRSDKKVTETDDPKSVYDIPKEFDINKHGDIVDVNKEKTEVEPATTQPTPEKPTSSRKSARKNSRNIKYFVKD